MAHDHPLFTQIYRLIARAEDSGAIGHWRTEVSSALSGRVLVVGLGPAEDLHHLPAEVTSVVAVEPSASMRRAAADAVARAAMPVEVIAKSALSVLQPVSDDFIAQIQAVLLRRPCTAEDLSVTLGAHINEVSKILRELNLQGKLSIKREARGVFYLWKE